MAERRLTRALSRFLADYGMSLVLLLLCAYYSAVTFAEQDPTGAAGGEQLAGVVLGRIGHSGRVLVVTRDTQEDAAFAAALRGRLEPAGVQVIEARGRPADARAALERIAAETKGGGAPPLKAIAANQATGNWAVLQDVGRRWPALGEVPVLTPHRYWWPNFLRVDNLRNIANQIVVIAVLAVGMTFVVITGGIDLSVGSLIALSAVTATLLIRNMAGAQAATPAGMCLCCLAAVALCGLVGLFSGSMVTFFKVPPFIVTLSMLLVASGLADTLSREQSIYEVPDSFVWLGGGADLAGVPNGVVLMAVLYLAAHVVMSRMTLGRYVYAVGGNMEAARLSGVPVVRVLLLVYVLSGALAGLGGIVLASQLRSGSPTYGQMYEMYVVAAVVVGGTSLSGGEGKVFGTLIGAFIIAVIRNGMNLTGVESRSQKIVFGLVILGAVLLDRFKKYGWALRRPRARAEVHAPGAAPSPAAAPGGERVVGRTLTALMTAGLALAVPVGRSAGQEWTRFRGPNGSGVSAATTVPVRWTEKDYNWKVELPGAGHSSPVLWGDRVFVTCADEGTGVRRLLCLHAADGRRLWARDWPGPRHGKHADNSYATATPAVDGRRVYVSWGSPKEYLVVALDHKGAELWRADLGPFRSGHGFGPSPVVHDRLLVVPSDQDGQSALFGLDAASGAVRWKVPRRSKASYTTPCVFDSGGRPAELIFTSYEHGITSIDPKTGAKNWEQDVFHKGHIETAIGSPVVAGDLVIGSCGWMGVRQEVVAVRPPGGGREAETVYAITSAPLCTTPLVRGDLLFLWGESGMVTCADVATGRVHWRERVPGSYYGSPVCVDGKLYCVSRGGDVVVLAASKSYQFLARNRLGEGSHSTPAVAGGVLYLRTFTHLISVGGAKHEARPESHNP